MFQTRNVKKTVAILCTAVMLAGVIPMSPKTGIVKAANPDLMQIPAVKVTEKEIAPLKSAVWGRKELSKVSYDAKKAKTSMLPMALTYDKSKTYEFKAETSGVYGFEIQELTLDIKSVNLTLVNKDTNETVKKMSGCKLGSHITAELTEGTNYAFTVSRNSGKKGSALITMGTPVKSQDFTSLIADESADAVVINDKVVFSGQKNVYSFKASKTGYYAFELKNIDDKDVEHTFTFSLKEGGNTFKNEACGLGDVIVEKLEAGKTYYFGIAQKIGKGEYTLTAYQPKDAVNIGSYDQLNDTIDYKDQENVYSFTAPRSGKYRFGVAIPDNAKGDKQVRLAIYVGESLYQISYSGEEFSVDLTEGTQYNVVVSYQNCLTPYTLRVYNQKPVVELGEGINRIKDCHEFTEQFNIYTFKAPNDGTYSFYLTDVTSTSANSDLKINFVLNDETGKNIKNQNIGIGAENLIRADLKGGVSYTLGLQQISGTSKYTLNVGPAKASQDVSSYRFIKDSVQYSGQANDYKFTAPADGSYRFQFADTSSDASKNALKISVLGDKNKSLASKDSCVNGEGVTAALKKGASYTVRVEPVTGFNAYTLVVGKTNEKTITPTPTPVPASASSTTKQDSPAAKEAKKNIGAFVDRIYRNVLNREPEAEGAAYWTDELYAFRRTGAEVAQGFIFSPEFDARKTSDIDFVTILYRTFFGREPESQGMSYWLNQLSTGAKNRAAVANGFIYSQEWADKCAEYGIRSGGDIKAKIKIEPTALTYAFVERMYTTAMCRPYDENGRKYWADLLANFDITGEKVGASFFLSEEMAGYKLTDAEFLTRVYATFMDRQPEADGFNYWLGVLAGGKSRSDVVYGFTRSPEFASKCVEARILPY